MQTREPDDGQHWRNDAIEREYLLVVQSLLGEWTTPEDAAAYDDLSGE